MKITQAKTHYFFVDESGDTTFYDGHGSLIVGQDGCSPLLIMGFIRTENPEVIRHKLIALKKEILTSPYFQGVPSLSKPNYCFHAKDDIPEVREKVFSCLAELDFKAEFIVGRKIEKVFRKRHQANEGLFYDDLIMHLFKNQLHLAETNHIYFSRRGKRDRQQLLNIVIEKTVKHFEEKYKYQNSSQHHTYAQTPTGEDCLQVVDYMNWAVQRAYIKGETRFLKFIESKISLICDIYDFDKYPKNFYSKKNPFEITKIGPL